MSKKHLFSLTLTAIFTAITVVLSRFFSINVWNMSIGLSFVGVLLCGMLLGSFWGGVCGGLADFVGAILFPFGTYFPGFTATAFLKGAVFGMVGRLYSKEKSRIKYVLLCTLLLVFSETVFSLLINSLWISILYGTPYLAVFCSRIPLCAITALLQVVFATALSSTLLPKIKKEF